MKKFLSILLAVMLCLSAVVTAVAEDAVPPAGVLGFLNYDEAEFAEASVIWNYLGIALISGGYVHSDIAIPASDPNDALNMTAKDYPVKYYDSLNSMIMGLQSGEIISFDIYSCVADYICSRNPDIVKYISYDTTSEHSAFIGEVLDRFSNGFSFMLLEENTALRDELNQAIADMKSDGTLDALIDTHITKVVAGDEPKPVETVHFDGAETIRVAVTGDLPPMDYVAEDGTVAGFNTALMAEIGKRLGKNIEFSAIDSGARAMNLASHTVDVVFWVRGMSTGSKTYHMTDEEFAAYKEETEKDFTPEEKEAIAKLDEILPREREYTRDMPDGTIITEPYFADIPVGVMTKAFYDYYVDMLAQMQSQAEAAPAEGAQ